jgi:hypothetical protein
MVWPLLVAPLVVVVLLVADRTVVPAMDPNVT